ncbi:MAG TPA: hypothetical protein VF702_00500 [Allosphingosinicella sp.]|jgi:hypothetical protein
MNDLTNSVPKDGRSLSELLETSEFNPSEWRVRRTDGALVLERIGGAGGIAPGYYTPETLPPLSEKARKILASVDAAVAKSGAAKSAAGAGGLEIEDAAVAIAPTDEPLFGIDPDS